MTRIATTPKPSVRIDDRAIVRALKALGHPTRFKLAEEIAAAGELSCGQLVERFPLSQPTISHHLKLLENAGVVAVRAEAKHHFFSIEVPFVTALTALVAARLVPR